MNQKTNHPSPSPQLVLDPQAAWQYHFLMALQPPKLSVNIARRSWGVGLLAFFSTLLVAALLSIGSLLWSPKPKPTDHPDSLTPQPRAHTVAAPERIRFAPLATACTPVADVVVTNLAQSTGADQPLVTPTNTLHGMSGRAGKMPAGSTSRTNKELAVFAALRASVGQPIPREVADLAKEITRNCKTDAERAKALYDWITGHITYDWKVWNDIIAGADTYTQPQDPLSVIQRGTGVCAGYAWLFDALTASVGMQANFVIGDVRGYRGTADDALISKFQHAWNSVQIDGQWYLLDSTWGARQNGESATDYLARRDYYFQTPPGQMIFDHLPETTDWQLLPSPVPSNAFQEMPNLKPAFFTDGLKLGNAFGPTLATPAGAPSSVIVAVPDGIQLAATLSQNGQDISANNLRIRVSGIRQDVVLTGLPPGNYILRLYARNAAQNGPYDCAADYAVTVTP